MPIDINELHLLFTEEDRVISIAQWKKHVFELNYKRWSVSGVT